MSTGRKKLQEPERSRLVKKGPKRVRSFRFEVRMRLFSKNLWYTASKHDRATEALSGLLKQKRGWWEDREDGLHVIDNLTGRRLDEEALRALIAKELL